MQRIETFDELTPGDLIAGCNASLGYEGVTLIYVGCNALRQHFAFLIYDEIHRWKDRSVLWPISFPNLYARVFSIGDSLG